MPSRIVGLKQPLPELGQRARSETGLFDDVGDDRAHGPQDVVPPQPGASGAPRPLRQVTAAASRRLSNSAARRM